MRIYKYKCLEKLGLIRILGNIESREINNQTAACGSVKLVGPKMASNSSGRNTRFLGPDSTLAWKEA